MNHRRKESQERARGDLSRLLRRRDEAVMKSWQIEAHCLHMEEILHQHNISLPASIEVDEDEDEDENEVEKEYENIADPDDNTNNSKRLRIE